MSEEKKAVVHDDELAAIKDSRKRELSVFKATSKESTVWIVAVSDHQAKLAFASGRWISTPSVAAKFATSTCWRVLLKKAVRTAKHERRTSRVFCLGSGCRQLRLCWSQVHDTDAERPVSDTCG